MRQRIINLQRVRQEERSRQTGQQNHQFVNMNGKETAMRLGDADKGIMISESAVMLLGESSDREGHVPLNPFQQRRLLDQLPPVHVLKARLNAYRANNKVLSGNVKQLQAQSSELEDKYKKVISICTKVEEDKIDDLLGNLSRAVESEGDELELARVREFLSSVEGV